MGDEGTRAQTTRTASIGMQTLAILVDAYRRLNSRKLFWLTLSLSGMLVLAVGLIGIDDNGLTVGPLSLADSAIPGVGIANTVCNTNVISPAEFYRLMFVNLGFNFWLSWGAAILGLISTADIFPDLTARGSIDLVLSKPLSRLRLFITHYVGGLLFVTLQVGVFTLASFLVLGVRGGEWNFTLFVAVPIVVLMFSYLYGLQVLFGVTTRSAMAALIMTLLCWASIWGLNAFEEKQAADLQLSQWGSIAGEAGLSAEQRQQMQAIVSEEAQRLEMLPNADGETPEKPARFEAGLAPVCICMPKTAATLQLLERWLTGLATLEVDESHGVAGDAVREYQKAAKVLDARSPAYIIGTSLMFELVVVGIAAWIFCRRDY